MMKKNQRGRRRSSGHGARKHLAFDRLETRQLLAGDLFPALGAVDVSSAVDVGFANPASVFVIQQNASDQTGVADQSGFQTALQSALQSASRPNEQTTVQLAVSDGDIGIIPVLIGDDGSRAVDPSNGLGLINPSFDSPSLQAPVPEEAPPDYTFVPLSPTIDNFEHFATTPSPLTTVGPNPFTVSPTDPFFKSLPTSGPADLAPISITVSTGITPRLPADEIGLEPTNYQYFKPSDQSGTPDAQATTVRTGLLAPYQSFGLLPNNNANSPETILNPATQSPSPSPTTAVPNRPSTPVTGGGISPVTQIKEAKSSEAVVELTNGISLNSIGSGYRQTRPYAVAMQADSFTNSGANYSTVGKFQFAQFTQQLLALPEQNDRGSSGLHLGYPEGVWADVEWEASTSDDPMLSLETSLETAVLVAVLNGIQTQQPSENLSERRRESLRRKF